jgi:hypothetical protein
MFMSGLENVMIFQLYKLSVSWPKNILLHVIVEAPFFVFWTKTKKSLENITNQQVIVLSFKNKVVPLIRSGTGIYLQQ